MMLGESTKECDIECVEFYSSEIMCKHSQNSVGELRSNKVNVRKINGVLPKRLMKLGVTSTKGLSVLDSFTLLDLSHLQKFIFELTEVEYMTLFGPRKKLTYILTNVGSVNKLEIE